NHVYVFDRALADRFASEGITTVHYMPLAANVRRLDSMNAGSPSGHVKGSSPEAVQRAGVGIDCDIAFVGSMYNEKHQLYERLSSMPDFAKGYLDGIIEAQMKVQGYFFMEEMLKGQVLEEMKKALEYKPNRDGVETPEYVYANYFLARKLAERERHHLLGMLSEKLPDSCVNVYTHNPTPELPKVHNMGAVDYYNDMPYVFKCSRINLNISLRSIQTGIPLRCMDIMGAGGFLMSNYQADLLEHFIPGEDFVYYESDEDLISKCRYYLEHDDERRAIAANGHIKVAAAHTYEDRVRQMFM
ncbi:MAG: glycosyltransferase, partial [Clostridia bacterium]|nr:glycosyltransferase [Clostridia bacterium]